MSYASTRRAGPQRARRGGQLCRDDWVDAARAILVSGGIAALGVRRLAAALEVTPGAFYWLFENLEELHEAIRQDWAIRNSRPFSRAIAASPPGIEQYLAWVRVLVLEDEFDPGYDNAMRDWAHTNPQSAEVLRRVELARIAELRAVFEAMGFVGHAAEIRARVTYYHQVGYNAMRIREPLDERLANVPFYAEILTDHRIFADAVTPDEVLRRLAGGGARRSDGSGPAGAP